MRRRILVRVGLAIALAPLLFELGLRTTLWARGDPWDPAAARAAFEAAAIESRSRAGPPAPVEDDPFPEARGVDLLLHPYTGYDTEAASRATEWQYRFLLGGGTSPELTVMFLGGSVANYFTEAPEKGAPRFEELLESDPRFAGRGVRVVGHGRPAYKQPQQTALLAHLIGMGFRPDAVVSIDGFNEVALASFNVAYGAHPAHPSLFPFGRLSAGGAVDDESLDLLLDLRELRREQAALAARAVDWRLDRSAALGRWARWRLGRLSLEASELGGRFARHVSEGAGGHTSLGFAPPDDPDRVLDEIVRTWAEGALSLHAMCAARGIAYLHVIQPALHDPGAKPWSDEERDASEAPEPIVEGVLRGYPRLREAAEGLRAEGVAVLDLSRLFEAHTETLFVDAVHLNARGNSLLAEALAAGFLERVDLD